MQPIQGNDKRLFGKQTEDLLSKLVNPGSVFQITPMNTVQRDALPNPSFGQIIANTDSQTLEIYSNGAWAPFLLNA